MKNRNKVEINDVDSDNPLREVCVPGTMWSHRGRSFGAVYFCVAGVGPNDEVSYVDLRTGRPLTGPITNVEFERIYSLTISPEGS